MIQTKPSIEDIQRKIASRKVYLWGTRQNGLSMCRVLERMGRPTAGFIDNSQSIQGHQMLGYPVVAPEVAFKDPDNPFIIISSGFYSDQISNECLEAGLRPGEDFVWFAELQKFDYQIDVAGVCNLRCISCPRGNMEEQPSAGYMSAETYKKVLDKILREDPFVGAVALYNWGEPLLNRDLAEIVRYTSQREVHSAISSNLNIRRDFSDVIKAKPTWFRISLSGYGKNYEITHTGGIWELFYENLWKLKQWREQYHPEMFVEAFCHLYKHGKEDIPKLRELCDELGFTFRFRHAALAPLENVEAFVEGREMTDAAKQTMELQALPLSEAMELARQQRDSTCFYERYLWITWDLKVAHCMERYDPSLLLVPTDFLSTPLAQIADAREDNEFCNRCKENAIHRCYNVYGDEKLVIERKTAAVLPILPMLPSEQRVC
ncbi:MAG TPA: radical SAM protein [Pirellulaceae bacterium]|nr:radical SAM protein [Pirellulaceae bacterium]